jgi:acetylornithine deacetylase/succinyl-diaminopimelate desuccinylase-like protein
MKTLLRIAVISLALAGAAQAQEAAPIPASVQRTIDQLRARALQSDNAFSIVESLTTEIGPRLAGSEAEARARDWAQAMLRAQGLERIRVEPFTIPFWRAETQSAEVVSPSPQRLETIALAGSPSTPDAGLIADVVRFPSLAALQAAPRANVQGRIVFIDEGMARTQDGAGYGLAVERRARCPALAQAQGALACVIRSVGTDSHRFAHQGGNARQATGVSLPAAAISNPDADQLARLIARGPVRLRLNLQTEMRDEAPSGNVIAEVRGREHPEQIVLLGAHLDSWDRGTGAVDDGAGVAIVTAAAALIADLPRAPRRTIRVVLFGSEETGARGGGAYAQAHADEMSNHVLAAESDFGAGPVWAVQTRFGEAAASFARALHASLRPLAISLQDGQAHGGADVRGAREAGVPILDLQQDGTDYFDVHHTADDTLDKVSRDGLHQNVAAWAVAAYLAAEMDWDFRAAH